MTKTFQFGELAFFIDSAAWQQWYPEARAHVAKIMQNYTPPEGSYEPLTANQFRGLFATVRHWADNSVSALPVHNPIHFQGVHDRGTAAFTQWGPREISPTTVKLALQMLQIAWYAHDACHLGAARRKDFGGTPKDGYSKQVSAEWVSALETIRVVQAYCHKHAISLPPPALVLILCVILSTTFGSQPPVVPNHPVSCITRSADAMCPHLFEASMKKAADVGMGEIPATGRKLESYTDLVAEQPGFYDYLLGCFDRMDHSTVRPISIGLGWRGVVESHVRDMEQLAKGQLPTLEEHIRDYIAMRYGK